MRWLRRLMLLLILLVLGVVIFGLVIHEPRPTATPETSEDGDALARKMQAAVNLDAWKALEAIRWDFAGRHQLLWDKRRNYVRVRWDDIEVLRPLDRAEGVVTAGGKAPDAEKKAELLKAAYAHWANDAFWLNPVAKLFDEGVTRSRVSSVEDGPGLLVEYASGGVTPGDAYLWLLDDAGRPKAWRMWVSNIPVGGLKATWEGWIEVGGAQISTAHALGPITLRLEDVRGGALSAIEPGPDPFAALDAR